MEDHVPRGERSNDSHAEHLHPADRPPVVRRTDEADRQAELGQIFEALTGSKTVIETQETPASKRCLDGREVTVSEYVSESVRNNGLSDAIARPDTLDQ